MAFFRNYSSGTISHSVLDEKEVQQNSATFQSSVMNEDAHGTYSGRGFDINMDVQYQSDAETVCGGRLQNGPTADDVVGPLDSHLQPSGRTGAAGRWGSTFWKDCQPMEQIGDSDSGQDSKSDYRDGDYSEDNYSDDRIDRVESEYEEAQKEANRSQKGQGNVPADEMLSDEYYEQDEENQSDPMQYRGYSCPMNFRPLLEPADANDSKSRGLRSMNNNVEDDDDDDYCNNDDADVDYEEEEDGNLTFLLPLTE